jgi:pimeloyl-ACP methyl ester carboxylesterase
MEVDQSQRAAIGRGQQPRDRRWCVHTGLILMGMCAVVVNAASGAAAAGPHPCRVEGLPNELLCGVVQRPLDPARPDGTRIDVHYLLVPAMARNKQPDAVLMLAGGPGQSAIDLAPMVLPLMARLNNRRDLVFIDQRGTGRSAPLQCADESRLPVQQAVDPVQQLERVRQCADTLAKRPHGDMRFFTTTIAMQDMEAVREQLGIPQWNLVGGSYGTRAALEYLRQFPQKVRRTVLDGVAPPDMALPASFSADGQAALDALLQSCEADTQGPRACATQYPQLRQEWSVLLSAMPRKITVSHPVTGKSETFVLTREALLRLIRAPLYMPALAAALPTAIHAASQGDFGGIIGLSGGMGNRKSQRLAMGMHFSVVCAEDVPRIAKAGVQPGADFGLVDAQLYEAVCQLWPRGAVADAFYTVPPAQSPVLLLSGGADPATPPRHGARVSKALGDKAQHIVVPQAGHGVMGIGCMRDVLYRFIAAADDASALPQDAACATKLPRPGVFLPVQTGAPTDAQTGTKP